MRHHGHYGDNDVVIYCDTSFSLSPSFSVCLWDFLPIFASLISLKSANTPLNKKPHDLMYNSCPHHNQTSEVWAIVVAILVRPLRNIFSPLSIFPAVLFLLSVISRTLIFCLPPFLLSAIHHPERNKPSSWWHGHRCMETQSQITV